MDFSRPCLLVRVAQCHHRSLVAAFSSASIGTTLSFPSAAQRLPPDVLARVSLAFLLVGTTSV